MKKDFIASLILLAVFIQCDCYLQAIRAAL